MAESISTAQGERARTRSYSGGAGGSTGPRSAFDETVTPGVDPQAAWRFGNSTNYRHAGSTSAQRQPGGFNGYVPGYGQPSARNRMEGITPRPQWDAQFQPHLGAQQPQAGTPPIPPTGPQPSSVGVPAQTPPTPMPTPATPPTPTGLPVLPPSPGTMDQHPIEQVDGSQSSVRQVTGLPAGQSANASFVTGQNTPKSLAKRTRPAIDPLAS